MFARLIFFILVFSNQSLAGFTDPDVQWKTINTKNFEIIFPADLPEVGQQYANIAERVFELTVPLFKEPPQKTTILLLNHTDDVNGFATYFPFAHIVLYLNLPNSSQMISDTQSWSHMLTLHEYVHILNIYPVRGIFTPMNYVFGNLIRPNGLLPTWYLEGLAVDLESRLTRGGRLRSARTEALYRTLTIRPNLYKETIDRINERSIPSWPGGRRAYLLGGALMNKVIQKKGDRVIFDLNKRFSGRVPYFINTPAEEIVGSDWEGLLKETYDDLFENSQEQILHIKKIRRKKLKNTGLKGDNLFAPSVSPNGKYLAYLSGSYKEGASLNLIKGKEHEGVFEFRKRRKHELGKFLKPKIIDRGRGMDRIAWLPDSSGFVYRKIDVVGHYYSYGDLYLHSLKTQKTEQLTFSERAAEPEVGKEGTWIYYTTSGSGTSLLKRIHRLSKKIETLVNGKFDVKLATPTAIDDTRIAYTSRENGRDFLRILKFSETLERWESSQGLKSWDSIRQLKNNEMGLYFISDKSGVPNLYLADPDLRTAKGLTNTLTEITSADFLSSKGEIIVSQLTDKGTRLYTTEDLTYKNPPSVEPLVDLPKKESIVEELTEPMTYESEDYSSWKYLIPRYWMPFFYLVEDGYLFSGSTSAGDLLGKQSYSASFGYDSLSEDVSYVFNYNNGMTATDLGFSFGEVFETRGGSDGLEVRQQSATVSSGFYLTSANTWRGSVSGWTIQSESIFGNYDRIAANAGVGYNSAAKKGRQSKDNVFSFSLNDTQYFSDEETSQYNRVFLKLSHLLKKPLPTGHSWLAQLVGSHAPDLEIIDSLSIGDTTIGGNYFTNLLSSSFLVRGYPSGNFSGSSMVVANLEYGFPLSDIYIGSGTTPLFVRDTNMSLFVDAVAVDGAAVQTSNTEFKVYERKEMDEVFAGAGTELVMNFTLGYHLPTFVKLGLYYGFNDDYNGGFSPFFTFGFGSLGPIGNSTKEEHYH